MNYQFTVTYDGRGQLIDVQFPGMSTPKKPEALKLPEAQIVKVVHLGENVISTDLSGNVLGRIHTATCVWTMGGRSVEMSAKVTYDGNGEFVDVNFPGQQGIIAEGITLMKNSKVTQVSTVSPLGLLLIFRFPDNKLVRCVQAINGIVISPPSDF